MDRHDGFVAQGDGASGGIISCKERGSSLACSLALRWEEDGWSDAPGWGRGREKVSAGASAPLCCWHDVFGYPGARSGEQDADNKLQGSLAGSPAGPSSLALRSVVVRGWV